MSGLTTGWLAATARDLGLRVVEGSDRPIVGGSADSRSLAPGQLFAAFTGESTDGNRYVADAIALGAAAAVCRSEPPDIPSDVTLVLAEDTRDAVAQLAIAWRRACGVRVVGITGTVGKTSTKEMVAAVLAQRFTTHKSAGNLNSREGLPLAILTMTPADAVAVLEMGIDAVGEMAKLFAIAEPEIGAVLNIGYTHVSKTGSIEATASEKLTLPRSLPATGTALLNADDARVAAAIPELACRVISFGRSPGATLRISAEEALGLAGTRFDLTCGGETVRVTSPLAGLHLITAAVVAVGAAMALGMPFAEAAALVATAKPESRMRTFATAGGVTILDDRYNSSPASLAGGLRFLKGLTGRRIAFVGKMAELGDREVEEHRAAGELASDCCDLVVTFGPLGHALACGAMRGGEARVEWYATKEEAAGALAAQLRSGDVVLVKGSRSEALETVLPLLEAAG
ncbi:MAG: UDP-N-acetylmuramoyl-tripeptide--D-alanyl-D-alanine ligase [Dehalococcoidia bacterium]